ncbi:hypothetical protein C6W10_25140 [Plantactinospora sp. BB1]|nr:hypothetical protein C6W10_25140 [Plantactinospora sp. BB1]
MGRLLHGLRLATLAIAVTALFGFALPLLLTHAETYRSLAQQVLAFGLLTAVAGLAGVRIVRNRSLGRARWVLLAAVVGASALAVTGISADALMSEQEWSFGVIGWFGLLLLVDHGVTATATFLGAHTVASFAQLALVGQAHEIADLVVVAAIVLGCQLPVLAGAATLRGLVATASAASADAARVRTAEAIAAHLHADRRARYADLATTCVPLLTELSTGSADLRDERVRRRYAVAAARLRRLFAEHDEVVDPLLHELRACLDLADRTGVAVYLGTCGEWPTPPLAARRALTEPALRIVGTATSEVRVTLLGSPGGVTVSVVADPGIADSGIDEPAGGDPAAATASPAGTAGPAGTDSMDDTDGTDGVTVTRLVDGSRVWVEARWQAKS